MVPSATAMNGSSHLLTQSSLTLDDETVNALGFVRTIRQLHQYFEQKLREHRKRRLLPFRRFKCPNVTLVLDLDETLVHASLQPVHTADDFVQLQSNGVQYQLWVNYRPHMMEFLLYAAERFEVVLFTASQQVYADMVIASIERKAQKQLFRHRLFRGDCVELNGSYVKDLVAMNRRLAEICIVDNSIGAFALQVDNGIPIRSWFDDPDDRELLNIQPILHQLQNSTDVRPIIQQHFGLAKHPLLR